MKKINIGINGLGRIGKCIVRAANEYDEYRNKFLIKKINTPSGNKINSHLLKYDSVHGTSNFIIKYTNEELIQINDQKIETSHHKDIAATEWKNIDAVMECSGFFLTEDAVQNHIKNGAEKVIISAPSKTKDTPVVLYGVNQDQFTNTNKPILSIGSCTTNAIATILNIINNHYTIKSSFVSTVHAATLDQKILDSSHKDFRRARSCLNSIIPTTTGATKTIEKIIPSLSGKLDGCAIRIPSQNVSLAEIVINVQNKTSVEDVHKLIKEQIDSNEVIKKVIDINDEELVSSDYIHTTKSGIIDSNMTKVIGDNMIKISCWYDNEWAFACRMLDVCSHVF